MFQALEEFFLLDNKLLYVCKDFIGYNPTISNQLVHYKVINKGEKVKNYSFEMDNLNFTVILTFCVTMGPIRGYKRIEIFKNGIAIIRYEVGGKGHGSNYREGNYYFVEGDYAFLVVHGNAFKDSETNIMFSDFSNIGFYFLCFKNIIVPTTHEIILDKIKIEKKNIYSRIEIEPLRQIEWEANGMFGNNNISIIKSSIPGFFIPDYNNSHCDKFVQDKKMSVLKKTEIIVNDKNYIYEKIL